MGSRFARISDLFSTFSGPKRRIVLWVIFSLVPLILCFLLLVCSPYYFMFPSIFYVHSAEKFLFFLLQYLSKEMVMIVVYLHVNMPMPFLKEENTLLPHQMF
jgi:hypothetical protein